MFVQQRSARVERPLTYALPPGGAACVGSLVRVPLGPREVYGYVISEPREAVPPRGVRELTALADVPPAFDAPALALARWIAARYCCSLGEALGPMLFAAALPRAVDRLEIVAPLDEARYPSVPPRLLRLMREDFSEGVAVDALLRHPEARRAGDRHALLASLAVLQRAGALVRRRELAPARIAPARTAYLHATSREVRGPRVRALLELVRAEGPMRRRDVLLAGFSQSIVARALREGGLEERFERDLAERTRRGGGTPSLVPTAEQAAAIDAVGAASDARRFAELLVQGVTGSGKTLIYLRAIERVLTSGGRAIVLVPEIALTPQTARRFEDAFGERVAVLHSGLSERERFESWDACARGAIDVVVGARSAVFAPLRDVRLIVVDEAHERSYKQDAVPRYDAPAVARERMRLAEGVLVLGSATPPLESYHEALAGRIGRLRLETRATRAPLPAVRIVDLTAEFASGNRKIFSTTLVEAIAARLDRGEKSVLFLNRRGSASFLLCRACGTTPSCFRCSVSMTVHRPEGLLRCHLCDAQRPIPALCPACGNGPIREFGLGTQKIVATLAELFPAAHVVRMDADSTTRVGDHARLLDEFETRGDVLVGTQMVAKGLDFPTVTLAAVVAADIGLHVADFRAAERTFDLITQVAGRSGRTGAGEAIVQTYSPAHPAIVCASRHDYDTFAAGELEARRALRYPPFAELIYLGTIGRDRERALRAADHYAELLRAVPGVEVLGPAPYAVARVNERWRFRLAVKADDAEPARRLLRDVLLPEARRDRHVHVVVNVDP